MIDFDCLKKKKIEFGYLVFECTKTTMAQEEKEEETLTSGISHIGLTVASIEQTFDNFFAKLGFKVIGGDENYPSKFISDGTSIITLWQMAKDSDAVKFDRKSNVGLHHIALKVSSKDKLIKVYETVKALKGVSLEFEPKQVKGLPWWHFMCYEPCGIRVEFTWHGE